MTTNNTFYAELARLERERDEARAQVDGLRQEIAELKRLIAREKTMTEVAPGWFRVNKSSSVWRNWAAPEHTCIKDDGGTPNRKCAACEAEAR